MVNGIRFRAPDHRRGATKLSVAVTISGLLILAFPAAAGMTRDSGGRVRARGGKLKPD